MLALYYGPGACSMAAHIVLEESGEKYEPKRVELAKGEQRTEEYLKKNPQGRVPALALDDGDILTQSLAIIEYLDEIHPKPPLLPADPVARAKVRALADLIACDIHPLNNLRVLQHLKRGLGQDEAAVNTWYRHWIAEGLAKFEADLTQIPGTGTYCHGEAPTMADCCLVPQIFNAQRYECDLAPYPETMRVFDACMKLDAFDRAQPMKQPDAQ